MNTLLQSCNNLRTKRYKKRGEGENDACCFGCSKLAEVTAAALLSQIQMLLSTSVGESMRPALIEPLNQEFYDRSGESLSCDATVILSKVSIQVEREV